MTGETPRSLHSSAWRFVLAGGANTLLTGAALSVLAHLIDPGLAYTIVFLAGMVLSISLAGGFVFGVRMTRQRAIRYVLLYLTVYVIGLLVVAAAERAGMPGAWSGLVVVVTAPLTFVGGRLLLVPPKGDATIDNGREAT